MPSSPGKGREGIVAGLHELAALLELHGESKFKSRAYARGARALEAARVPVEVLVDEGRLTDLPGVGQALARQIEEMHRTGTSELLEKLRAKEAEHRAAKGEKRTARREKRLRAAVAKYEARPEGVMLADALHVADTLAAKIEEPVHVVGSVSRSQELSDDLDVVVVTNDAKRTLASVAKALRGASKESTTDTSMRLWLGDGTHVDVTTTTTADLPMALAFERGSRAHVAKLVARAKERGLRLEPNGLFSGDRRLPLRDEAQLYTELGLPWIPPEMREDIGEIEAAARGDAFGLVERAHVRGFVHCHTTWSDGKHSVEEMARAAEERGAAFITITDHSSAAHYARGLDVERLLRQWDEIDEVQERVKIRILKGTEADILADGALDWPDSILERFDVVIASIHQRYQQDEAKMTARVLRAMRHPLFKIWGHPLGRLVRTRPPIPLRVEEVLDAMAESRCAIEISGDPHRLDLEPRWVRAARERRIPFVMSVDAHSMRELDNVRYATGLARRGNVRPDEVLNTRPASAFASAVSPTGKRRAA